VLRTNLSTRPFYNERVVHVAIGAVALVVLAVTAFNVTRVIALSRQNTELSSRVARDQAEAERLTREAAAIRQAINKDELALVAGAAREANELIDQRTFSWTAFFNYIEATLPPDVMLVAVRPSVKDGATRVTITVLARRTEDVDEFIEKLEATGAFDEVYASQADSTQQGLQRAILESVYTGPGAEPEGAVPADAAAQPAKPDTAKTDAAQPDAAKSDPAKPDPAKPDDAKPGAEKPGAAKTDVKPPASSKPPTGGRQ
jgi:Tfp pilus assembly protein PilN